MPKKDEDGVDTYDNSNYTAPVQAVIGMAGFSLDKFPDNVVSIKYIYIYIYMSMCSCSLLLYFIYFILFLFFFGFMDTEQCLEFVKDF